MKVQLGDREVWIEFLYWAKDRYDRRGVLLEPSTEACACGIRDAAEPKEPEGHPRKFIASAHVVRYYKDPPNRELARKAALTKALEELDHTLPYQDSATLDQDRSNHLLKQRRKLFWDAYLNRKRASPVQSRVLPASSSPPA